MTPVFCCGFECGVTGSTGQHWNNTVNSFSTTIVRTGSRSLRANPSAQATVSTCVALPSGTFASLRMYVYFGTLPNVDLWLINLGMADGSSGGIYFVQATGTIQSRSSVSGNGGSGFVITTGQWYLVELRAICTLNHSFQGRVNSQAIGQATDANTASSFNSLTILDSKGSTWTGDVYAEDFIFSLTNGDFPIGPGYVHHFIPTSDGTHNVAGANDFERSATGTDITNATTTAFDLINDVPLKSGVVAEYINLIAPPNATDYVEVVFGPAPGINKNKFPPRAVEVICAYASASAGTNNLRLALNDNGTTDDTLNTTTGPGTTAVYARKHYATPPTGGSWNALSAGAGAFNNIRMRCLTNDAAPDPWWASAMIEAEFAKVDSKIVQLNQSVNRSNTY